MTDLPSPRRHFRGAGLAAVAGAGHAGAVRAETKEPNPVGSFGFVLSETAGLRRFGYPVHTLLPQATDATNFRLERDGKAVPA